MSSILEDIASAESPDVLWKVVRTYFCGHGVTKISYHHFAGLLSRTNGGPGISVHTAGFPVGWAEEYERYHRSRIDPISELARTEVVPFYWRDVGKMVDLSAGQRDYLADMERANLGDGLAFQVFGPSMRNGFVALGLAPGAPRWSQQQVLKFQVVGQAAHLYYCEMTPELKVMPELTPREKEILHWISQGKSNNAIASILMVSRHTIDTLVRRIFDKLQATDRTTASLRGIGAGVIPIRA